MWASICWGLTPQPLSIGEGFRIMAEGVLHAIVMLWDAIVHAALGWVVIGPVLIFALYYAFRPLLVRAAKLRRPVTEGAVS